MVLFHYPVRNVANCEANSHEADDKTVHGIRKRKQNEHSPYGARNLSEYYINW